MAGGLPGRVVLRREKRDAGEPPPPEDLLRDADGPKVAVNEAPDLRYS